MPKSKNRKDHKKKVSNRNQKIKQEQQKYQKMQKEMLMKLIEEEKKKGLFDNTPSLGNVQGPIIEGPSI